MINVIYVFLQNDSITNEVNVYVLYMCMYCICVCTVYVYVLYMCMYCICVCTVYVYVLYMCMYCICVCTVYVYVLYMCMYCICVCTVYVYVLYMCMYLFSSYFFKQFINQFSEPDNSPTSHSKQTQYDRLIEQTDSD